MTIEIKNNDHNFFMEDLEKKKNFLEIRPFKYFYTKYLQSITIAPVRGSVRGPVRGALNHPRITKGKDGNRVFLLVIYN